MGTIFSNENAGLHKEGYANKRSLELEPVAMRVPVTFGTYNNSSFESVF